jgi:hypothetical protein
MARDFTIPMDSSRLSGTIDINVSYMATVPNGTGSYLSTVSGAVLFIPIIQMSSSTPSNIPYVQQVNGPVSLKNTGITYKLSNGGK